MARELAIFLRYRFQICSVSLPLTKMDPTPLTKKQLKTLLLGITNERVGPDVFQIQFANKVILHLSRTALILGHRKIYPDLKADQCVYIGNPPSWAQDSWAYMINANSDGLYETAKHVLAQESPEDLDFILTYNEDIDVRNMKSLLLASKRQRDKSPQRPDIVHPSSSDD